MVLKMELRAFFIIAAEPVVGYLGAKKMREEAEPKSCRKIS